jgi:hypothetical protein
MRREMPQELACRMGMGESGDEKLKVLRLVPSHSLDAVTQAAITLGIPTRWADRVRRLLRCGNI